MGKLREVSGRQAPWNGTKKQGKVWASERALKNRIHELEQQLARSESEKREQAHSIAKLRDEADNWKQMYERERAERRAGIGDIFTQSQVDKQLADQRMEIGKDLLEVLFGRKL